MYKATIKDSSRQLTKREVLAFKDISNAKSLDEVVQLGSPQVIQPADYVVLHIENDKADNGEYTKYIIVDKGGAKFVTGSKTFFEKFLDIYTEMAGEDEDYSIEISKKESNNYKGKCFLTCSII